MNTITRNNTVGLRERRDLVIALGVLRLPSHPCFCPAMEYDGDDWRCQCCAGVFTCRHAEAAQ